MKPAPFTYLRPTTLDEAVNLLWQHRHDDAKVLAGGQSLVPMMNFRVVQLAILIDINRIGDLDYIRERDDGTIAIGALARHAAVKTSDVVARHAPLIAEAYAHVAHVTIRNRGTIGGNLVHADAASEMPTVMCALDAEFVLLGQEGRRTIKARDFFQGVFTTAIEPHELLVEIVVPRQTDYQASAFEEVALRKGDFAISAVALQIGAKGDRCTGGRICVAGISDRPFISEGAESMLEGAALEPALAPRVADALVRDAEFTASSGVTREYRRDLTRSLTIRAVRRACAMLSDGRPAQ